MENTPKALIIAVTVLVTVLIITVAIKFFSSINGTTDETDKVGRQITDEAEDPIDVISGYEIKKNNDKTEQVTEGWYVGSTTNTLLELGKTYTVKFHYKVIENKRNETIGCGIGFNNPSKRTGYNYDIFWIIPYNNYNEGAEGDFSYTFTFDNSFSNNKTFTNAIENYKKLIKGNDGKIYIQLRMARNNHGNTGDPNERSNFKVECTKVRVNVKK